MDNSAQTWDSSSGLSIPWLLASLSSFFTQSHLHNQKPKDCPLLALFQFWWNVFLKCLAFNGLDFRVVGCWGHLGLQAEEGGQPNSPPFLFPHPHILMSPLTLGSAAGSSWFPHPPHLSPASWDYEESRYLRIKLPFDSHQRLWSLSICLTPDLSVPIKFNKA